MKLGVKKESPPFLLVSRGCRCRNSNLKLHRHDHGGDPAPLQAPLDGEGRLIVQDLMIKLLQAKGELPFEDDGLGEFMFNSFAGTGGGVHHFDAHLHAIIRSQPQFPAQFTYFSNSEVTEDFRASTAFAPLKVLESTTATDTKITFLKVSGKFLRMDSRVWMPKPLKPLTRSTAVFSLGFGRSALGDPNGEIFVRTASKLSISSLTRE